MIKQINFERTRDKVVRVIVIYDGDKDAHIVDSFDELTEKEMTFFKDNAKNVWWFGGDPTPNGVNMYIVNPYEVETICSSSSV